MTKNQLSRAMEMARATVNLSNVDIGIFHGFGLPSFKPVWCTIEQIAVLIRWQAIKFDGSIDSDALQELASAGRKKFLVLG
jgi:hypothetical protein